MGRGFEGPVQVGPHPWGTGGPWALVCNTRGVGRLDSESVRGCSLARGGSGWLHLASLGRAPELLSLRAPAWRGQSPSSSTLLQPSRVVGALARFPLTHPAAEPYFSFSRKHLW